MSNTPEILLNSASLGGDQLPWLSAIRQEAATQAQTAGFPTRHDERWKYTSLRKTLDTNYKMATSQEVTEAQLATSRVAGAIELVFVNGHFSDSLSRIPSEFRRGVTICTMQEAIAGKNADDVKAVFKQEMPEATDVFTWLNRASFIDGAFIKLTSGAYSEQAVHILNYSLSDAPAVSHNRNIIVLEDGAALTVYETSTGGNGTTQLLNNLVTDVIVAEKATLNYCRIQTECAATHNIANMRVQIADSATFNSWVFSVGAKLARHFMDVELNGAKAHTSLLGLFVTKDEMHADNRGIINHNVPDTTCKQLYKGILNDSSHGVFNGTVRIARDAQRTDATQMSRNLLLSRKARVDAKPELDVLADDVKAAHGAAVGQLSEEEIFYLQTRCISREEAVNFLIGAFMNEIIDDAPEAASSILHPLFDNYFQTEDVLTC